MKQLSLTLVAVAALALFGFEDRATASPITYTESIIGSGHLGSTPFTNAQVTLTLVADTSGITTLALAPGFDILINVGIGTVDIAGIGTATITDTVLVFSTYNLTAA